MKICFLSDAISEHTRRWSKFFAEKGHDVDLITWNPNHLPDYEPVKLHVLKKPFTRNSILSRITNLPVALLRVKKIIYDIKPDIIHAHSVAAYAWMAMWSGFRVSGLIIGPHLIRLFTQYNSSQLAAKVKDDEGTEGLTVSNFRIFMAFCN